MGEQTRRNCLLADKCQQQGQHETAAPHAQHAAAAQQAQHAAVAQQAQYAAAKAARAEQAALVRIADLGKVRPASCC